MLNKFNELEKRTILILDNVFKRKSVIMKIDATAKRVEQKLIEDFESDLAWKSIPLDVYQEKLPSMIRSSWVFVVRAQANTGAERHPNSHQFMMSYKGEAIFKFWLMEIGRLIHLSASPVIPLKTDGFLFLQMCGTGRLVLKKTGSLFHSTRLLRMRS
jgi:hypothetical protein